MRKGEKAIRILAPVTVKQRDEHGEETGEKRVFFRTVPVFDVSMTDPLPGKEPVPLTPPAEPITGDSHHHLIAPLIAHAARARLHASRSATCPSDGPGGWCDPKRRQIVVATGPANQQVRTLVHELAHAHGLGYEQYGREQAEVLVDCVTYFVLRLRRPRRRRRVDPLHRRLGRRRRPRRDPRIRRRRSTRSPGASKTRSTRRPSRPPTRSSAEAAGGVAAPGRSGLLRPDDRASPAGGRAARRARAARPAGRPHPGRGSCSPRPTPARPQRRPRGDEDELYRRHHRDLQRAVARAVRAPRELIEDACQTAWTILLRSQPDRDAIFAWLRVVAIHEAYRLSAIDRRDAQLERLAPSDGDWHEVIADPRSLDDAIEALEALRALGVAARAPDAATSRSRSRATATRRSARAPPGRTLTNVNKSLVKARARIRRMRNAGR